MKRFIVLLFACSLLTTACRVRPPDVSLPAAPAPPLVQALDGQRQELSGFKAVAQVETAHGVKRRRYESVAIVMDRGRLRIDGFGPLGESLFTLLWDGNAVMFRTGGERDFVSVGRAGLERAMGVSLSPDELCAALGGNVIIPQPAADIRAGCESSGRCMLQFSKAGGVRRVFTSLLPGEPADGVVAEREERYDGDTLVYRGVFEDRTLVARYPFPRQVVLENPARALRLIVRYEDVDVNVPVDEAIFQEGAR